MPVGLVAGGPWTNELLFLYFLLMSVNLPLYRFHLFIRATTDQRGRAANWKKRYPSCITIGAEVRRIIRRACVVEERN